MAFQKPDLKVPSQSAMPLAIAAIEDRHIPLSDPEMAAVDPAPNQPMLRALACSL